MGFDFVLFPSDFHGHIELVLFGIDDHLFAEWGFGNGSVVSFELCLIPIDDIIGVDGILLMEFSVKFVHFDGVLENYFKIRDFGLPDERILSDFLYQELK